MVKGGGGPASPASPRQRNVIPRAARQHTVQPRVADLAGDMAGGDEAHALVKRQGLGVVEGAGMDQLQRVQLCGIGARIVNLLHPRRALCT